VLRLDCTALVLFARCAGPQACLQAVCTRVLAHLRRVLARRFAYSHKALADKSPCLQVRAVLFASHYTYGVPTTPLQGKFSIPFCIALALRGYRVVAADFSPARLNDAAIMAIVPQVKVEEVSNQERWAAHIEVVLAGGHTFHADQHIVRGHPDNPMTWDDMEHKFVGLVEPVLGADTPFLLQALRDIETPGQLAQAMRLVHRQP
jgi:2-methylcitrate dehydratase PrpD